MSFDVFLQRFVGGEPAEASREKVLAVLGATQHSGPDENGYFTVRFPDGVVAELSAKGLDGAASFTGCAFHVRGMSSNLVEFIFEIAKAGDMVVLPAAEDFVPILSSAEQGNELPPDLQRADRAPIWCKSAPELEALLLWARVQALNKSSKTPIKDDELVVAVTRDGKIYLGRYMQKSKIRNYIEKLILNKYIAKLILWIGKADAFFFMRLLRLPYLMDLMRGNRKNNRRTEELHDTRIRGDRAGGFPRPWGIAPESLLVRFHGIPGLASLVDKRETTSPN